MIGRRISISRAGVSLALLMASGTTVQGQVSGAGQQPVRGQVPAPTESKAVLAADPLKPGFAMSPAVACLRVEGLEQFTPLPDATLTNADKLKVYFRPLHYKVETDLTKKSAYHAKFSEDGRIRRKGVKTPLAKEDKLLEYETRYESADYQIYLVNVIGLESLSPGEYEFDITLHDLIDGQATAQQTISFKIIPSPADSTSRPEVEPAKLTPAQKSTTTRSGRSSKRSG